MNSWRGVTGFLPALAKAGVMLGMGELLALRKQCDTRALDLLISVGTEMGCCGVVSHRSLGRLIQEEKPFRVPPVASVGTRCIHVKAVCL